MTDDLIERLRFCGQLHPRAGYPENGKLFTEAADALAAAQARIAELEAERDAAHERGRLQGLDEAAASCREYSTNHGSGMFEEHSAKCAAAIEALKTKGQQQ